MICLRLQRPAIKACFSVHVGASLILVKYVFPLVIRQVVAFIWAIIIVANHWQLKRSHNIVSVNVFSALR